ncbi:hypothetical protein [Megamonas funiformis]|uniref:hypothetical protein n=1 Tax=Megamonas funiformis TaxID=437897 RepID=UPI003F837805
MALSRKDLFTLAKTVAKANPSSQVAYSFGNEKFSYEDLNETLRNELREIAGTYSLYRENKNTIFALMEEIIDDVLPKKVLEQYGQFAEIKTFSQGDKPVFTQRITVASKRRAKQFITKVGLAGIYEVFKLDGKSYEVPTSAFGGAAQIGFEEFLDKRIDLADVLDIIMEGLDESLYLEIERALKGAVTNLQANNKTTQDSFVEAEMDKLLAVADSYGQATIYCTYEFAATMVPAEGWVSDAMKDQKWNNGYLASYKGHRVIVLPQSYEDETNSKKVIDPSYAWIIPTGGNDKPVKVALEGQTIVREIENADMSREIQVYKKMGVAAIITNNICVYRNTGLTQ